MTEAFSASYLTEFVDDYQKAADFLCNGAPGLSYGSLLGVFGPLRRGHDRRTEIGYVLQRPMNGTIEDVKQRYGSVSNWNTDFTLPVGVVEVTPGEPLREMTIEDFVGGFVMALPEEVTAGKGITEHHIGALSTGITIEYEKKYIRPQKEELAKLAKKHIGLRGVAVEDESFKNSATDHVLREAHIDALGLKMRDQIRKAHNIVKYQTADEILEARAWHALTRPDQCFGPYALSVQDASEILFGKPKGGK